MLYVFDRFLNDDLAIVTTLQQVASCHINYRFEVALYADPPCYASIFSIDGIPLLTENYIDGCAGYFESVRNQPHFYSFLLEYAAAKCSYDNTRRSLSLHQRQSVPTHFVSGIDHPGQERA